MTGGSKIGTTPGRAPRQRRARLGVPAAAIAACCAAWGVAGPLAAPASAAATPITAAAVLSAPNPSVHGQPVAFIAYYVPGAATLLSSTLGSLQFTNNGSPFATVSLLRLLVSQTLAVGRATLTTTTLPTGDDTIMTSYLGAALALTSGAAASGTLQVVEPADTRTGLRTARRRSGRRRWETVTAIVNPVAPGAGRPTGTITFLANGRAIATRTLSGGQATLTSAALAHGRHAITARYGGDANFARSPVARATVG